MSNLITTQINALATRFELPQSEELYNVLKATAFKGDVTDAQLSALLIVAAQHGLNPWTKEIYAFPDKKNGIIPVVSVDGWSRIINSQPTYDGMEFNFSDEMVLMPGANSKAPAWTECLIYRKDRSRPTVIREYLDEVYKEPFKPRDGGYSSAGPWQTHPKRFSRHKAMIQCARMAFGFGGLYDADEADRIGEASTSPKNMGAVDLVGNPPAKLAPGVLEAAQNAAESGVANYAAYWGDLSQDTRAAIGKDEHRRLTRVAKDADAARTVESSQAKTFDYVMACLVEAKNIDALYAAGELIDDIPDLEESKILEGKFEERKAELEGA